jgi:soluble lytic murein transglycosylase
VDQRFPMPFKDMVVRKSREIGLDPAYVYGLIRQESRFIMDARSGVGASGLMQVMPATARWTARKIGMSDFTQGQINDHDTNITIGTNYLKLALDDFDGSMALAAAAYNAGPGRPRNWRNGPPMEAAIWAENVPFSETRDYVKKVLANTTNYAALITGKPQSLKEKLGRVGPRDTPEPEATKDLP